MKKTGNLTYIFIEEKFRQLPRRQNKSGVQIERSEGIEDLTTSTPIRHSHLFWPVSGLARLSA